MKHVPFLVLLALMSAPARTDARDWLRFRGPNGAGTSPVSGLPLKWSQSDNIVWRTKLPGYGASCPITLGDRIYLAAYSGYGAGADGSKEMLQDHVICVDRQSGQVVWDKVTQGSADEQDYDTWLPRHGYASATPVTDGEAVYAFFGISGVVAYDLNGKKLWLTRVGSKTHGWGTAASPVVHENLLIVNASVESGSLYGLDKKTGKEVWTAQGIVQSYNTPLLLKTKDGKTELVVNSNGKLFGFDPANGEQLWFHNTQGNTYICPSVVAHEDIVYALCGRSGQFVAVRIGGRGDVTESHTVWRASGSSNVPSPVYHDGYLYWSNEDGIVRCLNAKDGTVVEAYRGRLPDSDLVYASPLAADGRLYIVSRERGTYVLALKPEFEPLSHNVITDDNSLFNASPVVSQGQLLLRSNEYLYCVGELGK